LKWAADSVFSPPLAPGNDSYWTRPSVAARDTVAAIEILCNYLHTVQAFETVGTGPRITTTFTSHVHSFMKLNYVISGAVLSLKSAIRHGVSSTWAASNAMRPRTGTLASREGNLVQLSRRRLPNCSAKPQSPVASISYC
jgi:hypothetical protein